MRPTNIILFVCLMPVSAAFCADDSGERKHPADNHAVCLDRNMNSASGGCITDEDGTPRNVPPQALAPAPDTTRQSPPGSEATAPSEVPGKDSENR